MTLTTTADSTNGGTTCTNGDTCSLRDAITLANSYTAGDIFFGSGVTGTITLTSALPNITGSVNISGPGANLLTVSGANTYQVLHTNSGTTVSISRLTIANGNAGTGGGINSHGTLTISNSTVSGNSAPNGGGMYNGGTLTISNSTTRSCRRIRCAVCRRCQRSFCGCRRSRSVSAKRRPSSPARAVLEPADVDRSVRLNRRRTRARRLQQFDGPRYTRWTAESHHHRCRNQRSYAKPLRQHHRAVSREANNLFLKKAFHPPFQACGRLFIFQFDGRQMALTIVSVIRQECGNGPGSDWQRRLLKRFGLMSRGAEW
ncbi:MAG: CSLREA domain-containing protein [Edaphobacter sp.]